MAHISADSDNDDHWFISDIVYPELFSTDKLQSTGENFLIWKLKLTFILTDRKLHHLLNPPPPPYPKPPPQLPSPSVSLILQTVDHHLLREFEDYTTAEHILGEIFSRFDSLLKGYRLSKIRDYMGFRMAADTHINQHIFRMRSMAKEIEYSGNKIPDDFQALVLLNSLPEDWEENVERLLMKKDVCKEDELSWNNVCTEVRMLMDLRKLRDFRTGKPKFKSNCHQKSDCPSSRVPSNQEDSASSSFLSLLKDSYSRLKRSCKLKCNSAYHDILPYRLCDVLRLSKVEYVVRNPIPTKETSEAYSHDIEKWVKDDFTCRHLILGTMVDDLFLSFHDYPTAKALSDALILCFNNPSPARKMYDLQKYIGHHMIEGTQTGNHISKMDGLVSKLCSSGTKVPKEIQSVVLIDSLPDTWKDDKSTLQWKVIDNNFNIDEVRKKVCKMGELRETLAAEQIHHSKRRKVLRGNCYSCGKPGHYRHDCPEQ